MFASDWIVGGKNSWFSDGRLQQHLEGRNVVLRECLQGKGMLQWPGRAITTCSDERHVHVGTPLQQSLLLFGHSTDVAANQVVSLYPNHPENKKGTPPVLMGSLPFRGLGCTKVMARSQ